MKEVIILLLILCSLFAYAIPDIVITDVTYAPSREFTGKDSIDITAKLINRGDSDFTDPFYVEEYVNGNWVSTCNGECKLNYDVPVAEGLAVGEYAELFWSGSITDEQVVVGENELLFIVGSGEGVITTRSIMFEYVVKDLPTVDLEISDATLEIENGKLLSVSALLVNHGPNTIEDDTIAVGFIFYNLNGQRVSPSMGDYIDLEEGYCEICSLEPGETILFNADYIDLDLPINETFLVEFEIDDINSLLNYEEINKKNSEFSKRLTLTEPLKESCRSNDFKCVLKNKCSGDVKDFYCGIGDMVECCEEEVVLPESVKHFINVMGKVKTPTGENEVITDIYFEDPSATLEFNQEESSFEITDLTVEGTSSWVTLTGPCLYYSFHISYEDGKYKVLTPGLISFEEIFSTERSNIDLGSITPDIQNNILVYSDVPVTFTAYDSEGNEVAANSMYRKNTGRSNGFKPNSQYRIILESETGDKWEKNVTTGDYCEGTRIVKRNDFFQTKDFTNNKIPKLNWWDEIVLFFNRLFS
ncbi:hypothetical protein ACFLZN_02600 [Nanoarchaeota archaeon]